MYKIRNRNFHLATSSTTTGTKAIISSDQDLALRIERFEILNKREIFDKPRITLLINPVCASRALNSLLTPRFTMCIRMIIYLFIEFISLSIWSSFGTSPGLYKYIIETFERSILFLETVKPTSCDLHIYDSMIPFLIIMQCVIIQLKRLYVHGKIARV